MSSTMPARMGARSRRWSSADRALSWSSIDSATSISSWPVSTPSNEARATAADGSDWEYRLRSTFSRARSLCRLALKGLDLPLVVGRSDVQSQLPGRWRGGAVGHGAPDGVEVERLQHRRAQLVPPESRPLFQDIRPLLPGVLAILAGGSFALPGNCSDLMRQEVAPLFSSL